MFYSCTSLKRMSLNETNPTCPVLIQSRIAGSTDGHFNVQHLCLKDGFKRNVDPVTVKKSNLKIVHFFVYKLRETRPREIFMHIKVIGWYFILHVSPLHRQKYDQTCRSQKL